jgi:hypothetical protein
MPTEVFLTRSSDFKMVTRSSVGRRNTIAVLNRKLEHFRRALCQEMLGFCAVFVGSLLAKSQDRYYVLLPA